MSECELCGERVQTVQIRLKNSITNEPKYRAEVVDMMPEPAVAEIDKNVYGQIIIYPLHRRTCVMRGGPQAKENLTSKVE